MIATVKSITAGLTKMVTKLEKLSEREKTAAANHTHSAQIHQREAQACADEAAKATKVAKNIMALME